MRELDTNNQSVFAIGGVLIDVIKKYIENQGK